MRERLDFDAAAGEIRDGPRRYLLLRPDVLMGALRPLEASQREALLEAFAQSAREHGGESIRAYHATLRAAGGDPREADTALLQTTASAAADLGWGRWTLRRDGDTLRLSVENSPFAAGFGRGDSPVCAPIRGLLAAVAAAVLQRESQVRERRCACQGHRNCEFDATAPPARASHPAAG